VTSPLAQIPLRRLPRNLPRLGSFGEVGIVEFGLKIGPTSGAAVKRRCGRASGSKTSWRWKRAVTDVICEWRHRKSTPLLRLRCAPNLRELRRYWIKPRPRCGFLGLFRSKQGAWPYAHFDNDTYLHCHGADVICTPLHALANTDNLYPVMPLLFYVGVLLTQRNK